MKTREDPGSWESWETALWPRVSASFALGAESLHGPAHWRRVRRNGLMLATRTGADLTVVRLFALFHDSRRLNEMTDPDHGARGAQFAAEARASGWFHLKDEPFGLLCEACVGHTDGKRNLNATIGTCWDADRLDLGRCGMIPAAEYMSTAFAREIADAGRVLPFLETAAASFSRS
jgi:uncharacterized protein